MPPFPPTSRSCDHKGPLGDISVIDLSSVGPASRCTRLLADFGADVVKVGPVGGGGSTVPPPFAYSGHRFMRRVEINVTDNEGKAAFFDLARNVDVVIESFRPGVVDRLGIGFEEVKKVAPNVVYCSTSGYGQSGPTKSRAGHDLNYLAAGGFLGLSEPVRSGAPPIPGATIADAAAGGMHAGLSILAALIGNRPTKLDVSVAEGVLWLMSLGLDESLATTSPLSFGHDVLSGKYACYALYETADGRHVAVAAIEQKFFANLCRALRVEDAIELQYNDVAQATLRKTLSSKFKQQALADWMRELSLEDVCVAPVLRADEIASWPQFVERGVVASAVAQDGSSMKQLRPLLAGMTQSRPVALIDFAKTDTTEMFSALGFDQEKLSGLEERGVLA